jgi:hypothetical protein
LYQKGRPEKIASLITSTIGDETLDAVEAETEALRKALT